MKQFLPKSWMPSVNTACLLQAILPFSYFPINNDKVHPSDFKFGVTRGAECKYLSKQGHMVIWRCKSFTKILMLKADCKLHAYRGHAGNTNE